MGISEKTALRHQKWKRDILDIIRRTPNSSRITVKRTSGLSMDSTLSLIGELLDEELIISVGKADNTGAGRKATLLEINPQGAYFIGVRFSAAGISAVLMDFSCRVVDSCRRDFLSQPQEHVLVDGIFSCIDSLIGHLDGQKQRLRGIGLGAPGIIDLQTGCIVRYTHIPDITNLALRQIVEDRYAVPVYLEHGVKCSARTALSEAQHAASRDLLFMQTGRGIHMCVIIGGQIHNGMHYLAGELGHMRLTPSATLESMTSSVSLCAQAEAIMRDDPSRFSLLRKQPDRPLSLEALINAASMGCPDAQSLLTQAGEATAAALSAGIMLINPQDIIINGTLCSSPHFERAVRKQLAQRCIPESLEGILIRFIPSDPREDATGAAMIPFHRQFSPTELIQ